MSVRDVGMMASISADQPITEAVRALLAGQLGILQEYEARYRAGERRVGVHQMRVSLRRMRALLRLYGDRFEPGALDDLISGMRKSGRKLGAVRDLDVLLGHLTGYQESLPEGEQDEADPVVKEWRTRRRAARKELDRYLGSKRYRRFVNQLAEFTGQPGLGVPDDDGEVVPRQVRHVLGSTIWRRYEAVWAYSPVLDEASAETLHDLRIECKYLRYSLEFFREVLGETKASPLIAPVVALQDYLGDLNDASVAGEMLEDTGGKTAAVRDRYLAHRGDEAASLTDGFPALWAKLDTLRYRRNLAAMLAAL